MEVFGNAASAREIQARSSITLSDRLLYVSPFVFVFVFIFVFDNAAEETFRRVLPSLYQTACCMHSQLI